MTQPVSLPVRPVIALALPPLPAAANVSRWSGLYGSAHALAVAQVASAHTGPVVIVTANVRQVHQWEEALGFYLGAAGLPVLPFPDWESLPYDAVSPHQDIISQRMLALHRLRGLRQGVVLIAISSLMHRLSPATHVQAHTFFLEAGGRLQPDTFRTRLAEAGYRAVTQVMEPGEFAVRGGIVDLFPMGSDTPYRLDLFDDVIEAIRVFDVESQRSGAKLERIELLPAHEYPTEPTALARFRQEFRAAFEGDPQRVPVYRDVSAGLNPPGIEYYLPLFFERLATFFDYLPANAAIVMEDGADAAARRFAEEYTQRYAALSHDRERPILPPARVFLSPDEVTHGLRPFARIVLASDEDVGAEAVRFASQPPPLLPVDHRAEEPYGALIRFLRDYGGRVLLAAETAGRRELLENLLRAQGFAPAPVADWHAFVAGDARLAITVAPLDKGLLLPDPPIALIAEPQLYGERVVQRRRRARARDTENIVRSLAELKVGDPVVHEEHGVGRYIGLITMGAGGIRAEFMTLEYAGGDKLYIPVTALHLVSRYTGTDPDHAPLHKLGSDAWEKAKRRAREKAYDAAAELLEVHALRAARQGHAFPQRDAAYAAFVASFPFEETEDQAKVIDEVLNDMEQPRPMDRLVCGDVGFGKTEVAMRAAFAAFHGGRQVAVLVPTTLLAQQHFQNFSDRFAGHNARIELLSRFRNKTEQERALAGLADGSVDIVIGTHRLLQDDIRFKRLGLVIIDEEHRFGVRQKERMKRLRAEVDVLTLTATPLPRTLNLALASLRDISLITTAPQKRLAVKTFVLEWNDGLIREACMRELKRGGQVYFLHNDVRTMIRALEKLQALVPEADIRMAHGQMPERELERVMLDFYHQRFNVLLCSTIIETGIDVPTANTIVIERADKFGLAQLHQLRGRVGRSHHRAYAYLLIPPAAAMTGDARKRLEAIAAFEDLGAGFALASQDLEIRGAGELLGEAQSGQIDEVGFTLYTELLNRAVASLKSGKRDVEWDRPTDMLADIDLHVPALLPDDYVDDPHLRLVMYKRIASAPTAAALDDLMAEIFDRFGRLPGATQTLFRIMKLKLQAQPLGVRKIDAGPKGARIEFQEDPPFDAGEFIAMLQSAPKIYRLDGPTKLRIVQDLPDVDARLGAVERVLTRLTPTALRAQEAASKR